MPHALRALAILGIRTREQPSSRAIETMLSPAAPPPATSVQSRGSSPSATVMSMMAVIIVSPATCRIAREVSGRPRPRASATSATAERAACSYSCMRPPRRPSDGR